MNINWDNELNKKFLRNIYEEPKINIIYLGIIIKLNYNILLLLFSVKK
jgi:hypothetical protein